jgi:DNA-binding CsgD family transcriptional regulator
MQISFVPLALLRQLLLQRWFAAGLRLRRLAAAIRFSPATHKMYLPPSNKKLSG